ncbi:MAG: response regulator [Candidatus Aureabacteria bacterium]|nr:response regulator [Candidatus Auribacterota bacterium]
MTSENKKATRVLVVDDEENARYILNLKLTMKKSFIVDEAENGKIALEKVAENKPDIIILDVMMPEMDGYECCKHLKENPETEDIPIIFLTAKTRTTDIIQGIRVGVDDYIMKPYDFEDLYERMMKIMESQKTIKRRIAD